VLYDDAHVFKTRLRVHDVINFVQVFPKGLIKSRNLLQVVGIHVQVLLVAVGARRKLQEFRVELKGKLAKLSVELLLLGLHILSVSRVVVFHGQIDKFVTDFTHNLLAFSFELSLELLLVELVYIWLIARGGLRGVRLALCLAQQLLRLIFTWLLW